MNVSKSVFVVLMISVISMLMLAPAAIAAVPTVSTSGVPANVVDGTSFKVTVTGASTGVPAGQAISTLSLASSNANFSVSSPTSVGCTAGSATCVAEFNVNVASGAPIGSSATLTATAVASNGEVGSSTAVSTVSGSASAGNKVPVKVEAVEVDNFQLSASDTNVRDLERGEDFTLKVKLTATGNAKDVEIRAFVTGFEFGRNEPISDSTSPFDVEKGVSYVKSLKLKLPERVEEDTYRIRVIVGGRDNDEITQNFRIKVTPTAHEVVIRDLSISPEDTVQAGRAILATVRVKNLGDKTEKDVKVRVSIPDLGVTATPDFMDELKSDESATSEEFFLRVDQCARPGTYDVKAEVTFEQGDKVATAKKQITVTKGPCEAPSAGPSSVSAKGVKIAYNAEPQVVEAGGAAVSYTITIINDGAETKSYSISVSGADWATVRLSPSNMVTVKPGDSQTVFASVSAKRGAAAGGQVFSVRVKDQAGDVVKELSLSANVVGSGAGVGAAGLVQLLQLGLIVLIVVLVVVGVVVAFRRMKGPGQGEEGAQTYY